MKNMNNTRVAHVELLFCRLSSFLCFWL